MVTLAATTRVSKLLLKPLLKAESKLARLTTMWLTWTLMATPLASWTSSTRLGGVEAFGIPKTEARADTGAEGTLMEPGTTAGFTRQYFQAAVFQLAEDGSVQLTLLGDTLRGMLVPGFADEDAFGAADALSVGDEVSPPVISS